MGSDFLGAGEFAGNSDRPWGWARGCPSLPSLTLEGAGFLRRARWAGGGEGTEVLKPLALPSRSSSPGTGPAGQQGGNVQPRADRATQTRTEEACLGLQGQGRKWEAGPAVHLLLEERWGVCARRTSQHQDRDCWGSWRRAWPCSLQPTGMLLLSR